LHSNSYRTSALEPITWLCGEDLHSVPHSLTATQQAKCVTLLNEFVRQLPSHDHTPTALQIVGDLMIPKEFAQVYFLVFTLSLFSGAVEER
jgi:hypothetical protein